jgi:V/A-type H+/Na+-transporting ATPase subunit B
MNYSEYESEEFYNHLNRTGRSNVKRNCRVMTEKRAFQKVYTRLTRITKATCSVRASGVGYDELALVNGRLAQVVKIIGDEVTLQIFSGTEGVPTNGELVFWANRPPLKVSDDLAGRFLNAYGEPIDGGPALTGRGTVR